MWNVERIVSKGLYNYAVVQEHPNATEHGYVLEHRIAMENFLGRLLNANEVVHHENGDTKDNRLENLRLMSSVDRRSYHGLQHGKRVVVLKCPEYGSRFRRRKGQTYLQKGGRFTACSPSCRGKFSRKLQTCLETAELERAISENIVEEYRLFPPTIPSKPPDKGMRRGHTPST